MSTVVLAKDVSVTCKAQRCIFTHDSQCRIETDGNVEPYGAVIDAGKTHPRGFGYLWTLDTGGNLQRIDTETGETSKRFHTGKYKKTDPWNRINSGGAYGITVDHEDRIWMPAKNTDSSSLGHRPTLYRFNATKRNVAGKLVSNFDPQNNSNKEQARLWDVFQATSGKLPDNRNDPFGSSQWRGRGVTTELLVPLTSGDPVRSRIWGNFNPGWSQSSKSRGDRDSYLLTFDAETGLENTALRTKVNQSTACRNPVGAGMGAGGLVWVSSMDSDRMCAFDPKTLADDGMAVKHAVRIGNKPYTYSDFTGNIFKSFTNPEGVYRILIEGCPAGLVLTKWNNISWEAEVPGTAKLEVRFRFGENQFEALNPTGPQVGPVTKVGPSTKDLDSFVPAGGVKNWVVAEFRFLADGEGLAPILYDVSAVRSCAVDGG